MQAKLLDVYPVMIGQREGLVFNGVGPSSYSQTTKDVIVTPPGLYLDSVEQCTTVSGTYALRAVPSATGTTRATWKFVWYVISTGAEVANAVDLSAEKVQFGAFGGSF